MILSMYQKAVLVSELQEMKRLKQSPHNYKFSHNWVYKHKMQRMWSMQGFLLAPQFHTLILPRQSCSAVPQGRDKSWLPACLSLSTCTHLSQQTHPSWPSAGSPHKIFCTLGFFLLALTNSLCQNQLYLQTCPVHSEQKLWARGAGLTPQSWARIPHTITGDPLNEHLSWALCHLCPAVHLQLCSQVPGIHITNCRSFGQSQHCRDFCNVENYRKWTIWSKLCVTQHSTVFSQVPQFQ